MPFWFFPDIKKVGADRLRSAPTSGIGNSGIVKESLLLLELEGNGEGEV